MSAADPPDFSPRLYALVPCAGVGERAGTGGPKQYARLAGKSMVAHTLAALSAVKRLTGTMVVLSAQDQMFERYAGYYTGWAVRCGGATRAQTVANGLGELIGHGARPGDWVLVHDAARCLVQPEWVDQLIDACIHDAVGGLLALPLTDTLKLAREGRVAATIERGDKWIAQTPQMFRLGRLRDALAGAGAGVTDESSAIEATGQAPLLVRGHANNFKVTWPQDFAVAEQELLRRRGDAPAPAMPVPR
jgi:2-C-methyl-D-erythritol 4-phosphate cytidylyltransferase